MKELNTKKNEWKVNGTHKSESGFNKKNNGIMHKSLKKKVHPRWSTAKLILIVIMTLRKRNNKSTDKKIAVKRSGKKKFFPSLTYGWTFKSLCLDNISKGLLE